MSIELTSESTHEDIQEFVDQIVEDQKGEEKDEGTTSDSQKIAEERDKPVGDMTAEEDSGSKDTAEGTKSKEGDDSGQDEQADWLDDDLKAEVSAYGIDEKELADFTSREELERAMRFLDRSALEAGRKAMAQEGKADEGDSEEKEDARKETTDGYEVSLDRDVYDDGLVDEFTRMRDHYESRVAALESRFSELDSRVEEQHFDNLVDSLGHSDLFGKSGSESEKELQRRQDLYVQVKAHLLGLQQLGRPTELDSSLINRVARMVFAEELGKKDLKNRTRRIARQSDSRQGGGTTRPQDPAESPREYARRLYKELGGAG